MADTTPSLSDADRAKFSGLVAKVWSDPELAQRYASDGQAVLTEHGITVPEGMAVPVIPERPEGDLSIEELDTIAAGLSVSSLACAACPVSSFSSLSN